MAELDNIRVEFENTNQAASDIDNVANSLDGLSDSQNAANQATEESAEAAEAARRAQGELAQRSVDLMGKIAAVTAVVQGLVAAFGSDNDTAALVGRMAAAGSQGAALGLAFGPTGALVGGIAGALIPVLTDMVGAFNESETATREAGNAAEVAAGQYRTLVSAMDDLARNSRLDMGLGSAREYAQALDENRARRDEILASLNSDETSTTEAARLRQEYGTLLQRQSELEANRARSLAEEESLMSEDLANAPSSGRNPTGGGGGGVNPVTPEEEVWRQNVDAVIAAAEEEERIRQYWLAVEREEEEAQAEYILSLHEDRLAREEAAREEAANQAAYWREFELDELERQEEEADQIRADFVERFNDQQEEQRKQQEEQTQFLADTAAGAFSTMSGAVIDLIKANESGEQSFDALLKGFLEYISEWATFNAIGEFAQAIASAATQKWDAFGLHMAAGAAFTALAVGTGVGAAAITPPTAAPSNQQNEQTNSNQNTGNIIINYNSPIVTAGTTAELGRQMGMVVDAGTRRFGRG